MMASTGYALAPYIDSKEIPMTYPVMAPDDLTQTPEGKMDRAHGMERQSAQSPPRRVRSHHAQIQKDRHIGLDYAFGWEVIGGFQRTFEENGGKIVQKIWCPLTTQDFGPYLSQISKDIDAVLALFAGRSCLQFAKQYQEFGLKGKIPVIAAGPTTDESVLPQMGDEVIGYYGALHYSAAIDNPANKKFVKTYREKAKKVPSYFSETCYTGADGSWRRSKPLMET